VHDRAVMNLLKKYIFLFASSFMKTSYLLTPFVSKIIG
jgi:hypothetical protein